MYVVPTFVSWKGTAVPSTIWSGFRNADTRYWFYHVEMCQKADFGITQIGSVGKVTDQISAKSVKGRGSYNRLSIIVLLLLLLLLLVVVVLNNIFRHCVFLRHVNRYGAQISRLYTTFCALERHRAGFLNFALNRPVSAPTDTRVSRSADNSKSVGFSGLMSTQVEYKIAYCGLLETKIKVLRRRNRQIPTLRRYPIPEYRARPITRKRLGLAL